MQITDLAYTKIVKKNSKERTNICKHFSLGNVQVLSKISPNYGAPIADLEIILSFLAAWLPCQKISAKNGQFNGEKLQNLEENALKFIFPTENQRN